MVVGAGHQPKPCRNDMAVDELGVEQCCNEVAVLLTEGAQLGDAEICLVEAPAGKEGSAIGCGGVGVLNVDQAVAPAVGQRGGLQVDAVDAEAVQLLEG